MATLRVALAQLNPTVGDIAGNVARIIDAARAARKAGAALLVAPELAVSGYPPEDLLIRPRFVRRCEEGLDRIARESDGIPLLVGSPVARDGAVCNAACVIAYGRRHGEILKHELPNYGVFDERRYFRPGGNGPLLTLGPARIGVTICEDIWVDNGIVDRQAADGANLLVNLSGSPYRVGVHVQRTGIAASLARRHGLPFAYCNMVGGQDELVFDGSSFIVDGDGTVTHRGVAFEEDLLIADIPLPDGSAAAPGRPDIDLGETTVPPSPPPAVERRHPASREEEIYGALVLGVRDYVGKNRFPGAVIALSGGIDSALVAAIAVDALGPERVEVISMPSPWSSKGSVDDAAELSARLGLAMRSIPIEPGMAAFERMLAPSFAGRPADVAEENVQARIRGTLVMGYSNKFGHIVLATGNKSELAVGYCTLYGDMAGGFAVIRDLFKTVVYGLCRWRNGGDGDGGPIPRAIIDKEPSAELRPGQKDSDSLPPYDQLDPILGAYIEENKSIDEIVKLGYSSDLVARVVGLVDRNEYKRRQAPLGVKITVRAFGRDRRHPVTCRYVDE